LKKVESFFYKGSKVPPMEKSKKKLQRESTKPGDFTKLFGFDKSQ
jgi:hypothetical protein